MLPLSQTSSRRIISSLSQRNPVCRQWHRTLVAAPGPRSGPLLERRADRELPNVRRNRRWLRTLPIFLGILTASALAIFNYQKSSSSVVSSTLYALRTNPKARDLLGDEIYFRDKIPWIWGEMNQLHGRINISFWVKGKRADGLMRFKSTRDPRQGTFETQEWSLETNGQRVELLDRSGVDPFQKPSNHE